MNENPPKILIVDDDRRMASTLADILTAREYRVAQAHSAEAALEAVRANGFDCVISDIAMPGMDGADLCEALKEIRPELITVLMTAYASEEIAARGLEKGALAVLEKPLDLQQALEFLSLLRKTRAIVIVDDDPEFCRTLAEILAARGYGVTVITDPRLALEGITGDEQAVLLDMKLGSTNGYEVLKKIRARYPSVPVLLATGYGAEMGELIQQALAINARACLYKPLSIPQFLKALEEIRAERLKKSLGVE